MDYYIRSYFVLPPRYHLILNLSSQIYIAASNAIVWKFSSRPQIYQRVSVYRDKESYQLLGADPFYLFDMWEKSAGVRHELNWIWIMEAELLPYFIFIRFIFLGLFAYIYPSHSFPPSLFIPSRPPTHSHRSNEAFSLRKIIISRVHIWTNWG